MWKFTICQLIQEHQKFQDFIINTLETVTVCLYWTEIMQKYPPYPPPRTLTPQDTTLYSPQPPPHLEKVSTPASVEAIKFDLRYITTTHIWKHFLITVQNHTKHQTIPIAYDLHFIHSFTWSLILVSRCCKYKLSRFFICFCPLLYKFDIIHY